MKESLHWPNGITLDLLLDRIYWIDAKLSIIGSADLDGANSRCRIIVLVASSVVHSSSCNFQEKYYLKH